MNLFGSFLCVCTVKALDDEKSMLRLVRETI